MSMGCEGPKSAIEVRSELTFLDLTVRQVEVNLQEEEKRKKGKKEKEEIYCHFLCSMK